MSKRIRRRRSPQRRGDAGQLDETLTEMSTSTAATLKKYRYHLIAAATVVALVMGGFFGIALFHESDLSAKNERVWRLVLSPEAREDGHEVSLEALRDLLADAENSPARRYVMKSVGEFLTTRALKDETADDDHTSAGATADVAKEDAYRDALALARKVAETFPDDEDMKKWATGVTEKLEGEYNTEWMPSSPKYKLPVPK